MCSPLASLSVAVRCFNREGKVDCSKPMRAGTRAKGECKSAYTQIRPTPYTEIFCRDNGQWSYESVSYTHLDVYKRQECYRSWGSH